MVFQVKIGPYRLTQRIVSEHGLRGLFRGLDSTIAREMPGYFVFFGGYELTRELLAPPGGNHPRSYTFSIKSGTESRSKYHFKIQGDRETNILLFLSLSKHK